MAPPAQRWSFTGIFGTFDRPSAQRGFQVTVVRTVRDKSGKVIHKNTWFSNYARITGITLVGR